MNKETSQPVSDCRYVGITGNPVAQLIARLRLDRNHVILRLDNLYDDEDEDDDDDDVEGKILIACS